MPLRRIVKGHAWICTSGRRVRQDMMAEIVVTGPTQTKYHLYASHFGSMKPPAPSGSDRPSGSKPKSAGSEPSR